LVTTSYPRFRGDFAGNFVRGHVAQLGEVAQEVEVVAAGDAEAPVVATDDQPVTTTVLRVAAPSGLFYRGGAPDALEAGYSTVKAGVFCARLAARVAVQARRWDAVIAHWLVPSGLAAIATRGPLLVIAHGGDVHALVRSRLLTPAMAALAARGARLGFVSERLRQTAQARLPRHLARWLDEASLIQPMGVDTARFSTLPWTMTSPPTIAVISRLVEIKGVDLAIEALRYLRAPAQLVIAGDGPLRAELQRRADSVSVATGRGITFLGRIDEEDRDRLLGRAALVVLPSRAVGDRREGVPTVSLEARAAGRPVVATAATGLAPGLAPGLAIAGDDPRALARAIDQALSGEGPAHAAAPISDWSEVATRLHRHWLAGHPA
jgi:glycosyltransferase involved in cell wall biosynthesis